MHIEIFWDSCPHEISSWNKFISTLCEPSLANLPPALNKSGGAAIKSAPLLNRIVIRITIDRAIWDESCKPVLAPWASPALSILGKVIDGVNGVGRDKCVAPSHTRLHRGLGECMGGKHNCGSVDSIAQWLTGQSIANALAVNRYTDTDQGNKDLTKDCSD